MQYQSASSELRSPPRSIPFAGIAIQAGVMLLTSAFLAWLI
jgi:hypothetical protein